MDCHLRKLRALALALGLLTWVGGCTRPLTSPGPSAEGGRLSSIPPDAVIEKEKPPPPHPPMPDSCVSYGNFFAEEALNRERGTTSQEQLRESARKAYQQALELDPKYLPAYRALANLYMSMDDYEHAVNTYLLGLRSAPREPILHYELGMCYARKKDWPQAIQSFRNALDLDPQNRPYTNTLGFALARAGQFDASLQCFARVQSEPLAHFQLARMLHHLKQIDLCRRELQIALAQDPRLEQARKLLAQLDVGAPVSGVQTVGYVEPQPAPAAPPAPPPPAPEAQPAIVEVKPELNAGRRILPPPPIFESTPSSKPEASRVDAWESEW